MRHMNIPHKVYWQAPEREPVVRAMVSWDTAVLLSMTLIALTSVPVDIALLSDNPHATSPLLLLVPVGILVVAMVCYLVWMVTRRYRPPAD